ncbi:MAG: hypothetical protein LCH54_17230 [Bacteroidetes bacterium]|nr:hypothetical protein [Bacteroidota bacterium]
MAATLTFDQAFLNTALSKFKPEKLPDMMLNLEENHIIATVVYSVIGVKIKPSVAIRIVSFYWSDFIKTITFEVIKTSPLDIRPTLAFIKPFLPNYIRIEDTALTLDLLKIPGLTEVLTQQAIAELDVIKMGLYKGHLALTVDFKKEIGEG